MTTSWIDLGLRPLTLLKRLVCPPVSEPSPASLFFPPSDRDVPVNVYTVDGPRRNVLDDSNAVDNVGKTYVEHIGYWKGTYKTQHEFVLFRLRDQSNASRKNVMILDPVPDEENTLHPTVEGGTPSLAIEGVVQGRVADKNPRQGNPSPLKQSAQDFSLASPSPSKATNPFRSRPAKDCFAISISNDLEFLCKYRDFDDSTEILSRKVDHRNLSVEMIIVLACTVSTHRPHYDLGSNQCYWYAGVVWEITCALDDPSKPIPYSDLKGTNAGLLWLTIRPDVSEYDDAKALAPKYERDWAAFWEEVKERQGHGMPARIRESEKMVQVEVEARAAAEKRVQEEAKARATVENRMQEETKARVSAEEKARIAEKKLEIARELIETMKKKLSSGQLAHWPHAHSVCTTF